MCRHCGNIERVMREIFAERGWTYTLTLWIVGHGEEEGLVIFIFKFVHNGNPVWDCHTCRLIRQELERRDMVVLLTNLDNHARMYTVRLRV